MYFAFLIMISPDPSPSPWCTLISFRDMSSLRPPSILIASLLLSAMSIAQTAATLSTVDTRIRLEALPVPRLSSLENAGRTWKNKTAETLVSSVETDGQRTRLEWKWNTAESHVDTNRALLPRAAFHGTRTGWYVGIEFSGRTHLTLVREGTSLHGEVALHPNPATFRPRLKSGETSETTRIFLGATGRDRTDNVVRRWVREVLTSNAGPRPASRISATCCAAV